MRVDELDRLIKAAIIRAVGGDKSARHDVQELAARRVEMTTPLAVQRARALRARQRRTQGEL